MSRKQALVCSIAEFTSTEQITTAYTLQQALITQECFAKSAKLF